MTQLLLQIVGGAEESSYKIWESVWEMESEDKWGKEHSDKV